MIKNSILAYLGIDLGTNKLKDIYNNKLAITNYDNKEKDIDDILNLTNKIDKQDKLI